MSLAVEMLLGCLFVNSNTKSAYIILAFAIIFALCFVLYEINNKLRIIFVILSLIFSLGIFITGSIRYNNYLSDKDYFDRIEEGDTVIFQGELAKKEKKTASYYLYFKNVITNDLALDSNEGIILQSDSDDIPIGSTVIVEGKKVQFNIARNEGNYDEKAYYNSIGILMKVKGTVSEVCDEGLGICEKLYRFKEDMKMSYSSNLPGEEAGIVSAMTLGDKSDLDSDVKELFNLSGLAHILAISGLHISIVGMSIYRLLRKRGISFAVSGIISSILVILYGIFCNGGVSTTRAVIMFLVMILANILGESYDMLTAIGVALIVVLFFNPYCINSAGFVFSFVAVAGIGIVVGPLVSLYEKYCRMRMLYKEGKVDSVLREVFIKNKKMWLQIKKAFLSGVLIQLVTLPIVCFYYYEIPIYVVLLNCLVIPLLGLLLGTSLIGGIVVTVGGFLIETAVVIGAFCGEVFCFVGSVLLYVSHFIVYIYEMLAYHFLQLPFARIVTGAPAIYKVLIYYAVLVVVTRFLLYRYEDMDEVCDAGKEEGRRESYCGALYKTGTWRGIILICCFVVLAADVFVITNNSNCSDFEIDVVDVGQGDGIFVKGDNNYFFDGGSSDIKNVGTYRILPFLKCKGISHIDYWFVSHVDSDHISGLIEALDSGYSIENIVVDKYMTNEENYQDIEVSAKDNGVNLIVMNKGDVIGEENLKFTCIFAGDDSMNDINANSLVLLGEYVCGYNTTSMLIGGDMTVESEECVLRDMETGIINKVDISDIDILKVSHHGSKTSSSEKFLETISPGFALISAGVNNRYHHPSSEVIERLDAQGVAHKCTNECGRLRVTYQDDAIIVESFL